MQPVEYVVEPIDVDADGFYPPTIKRGSILDQIDVRYSFNWPRHPSLRCKIYIVYFPMRLRKQSYRLQLKQLRDTE